MLTQAYPDLHLNQCPSSEVMQAIYVDGSFDKFSYVRVCTGEQV